MMKWPSSGQVLAMVMAIGTSLPVGAEDKQILSIADSDQFFIDVSPTSADLSDDAERAIAAWASPFLLHVEQGHSPREAIAGQCNFVGPGFWAGLEDRSRESPAPNGSLRFVDPATIDQPVESDTYLLSPECYGRFYVKLAISDPKGLWGLRQRQNSKLPWEDYQLEVERASGVPKKDLGKTGTVVAVPPTTYRLEVTDRIDAMRLRHLLEESYGDGSVKQISVKSSAKSKSDGAELGDAIATSCAPSTLDQVLQGQIKLGASLREALAINSQLGREPKSVTAVTVLDGGISDNHHMVVRRLVEAGKQKVSDDPDDETLWKKYVFYPSLAPGLPQCPREGNSWVEGEPGAHALAVGSVVDGGAFASLFGDEVNVSVIPISIHSVNNNFDPIAGCFVDAPDQNILNDVITRFKTRGVERVVLMSQSFNAKLLPEPENFFAGDEYPSLKVVSAGNSGSLDGVNSTVYPAFHGGLNASSLIVVGALDGNGELLERSGFSPTRVDIGAPGCNIPVLRAGDSVDLGFASGTSFAAPQVAYVSALIFSYFSQTATFPTQSDVKDRILASADLNPAKLGNFISGGRVLNAVKALSLFQDIVEDDAGNLKRGKVKLGEGGADEVTLCADKQFRSSKLRKIARVTELDATEMAKIYWVDQAGELQITDCIGWDIGMPVSICETNDCSDAEDWLSLDDFRDIVFSMVRSNP